MTPAYRIGRVAELPDTSEIRGMIAKVKHLVRVVYATSELDAFVDEASTEYRDIAFSDGKPVPTFPENALNQYGSDSCNICDKTRGSSGKLAPRS